MGTPLRTGSAGDAKMADMGDRGCHYINDTAANTGTFFKILVLHGSTRFALLTVANWDGDAVASGDSFAAGIEIHGQFSAITLVAGAVLAYKV